MLFHTENGRKVLLPNLAGKRHSSRQKIIQESTHPDFEFLQWGPLDSKNQPTPNMDADFVMRAYGSNCGKLFTENLISLRPKSYHWIKAVIDLDLLKERFASLDYSISKDTCRQDCIGRKEFIHFTRVVLINIFFPQADLKHHCFNKYWPSAPPKRLSSIFVRT